MCTNKAIRKDQLESFVINELDRLLSEDGIDQLLDSIYNDLGIKINELPVDRITSYNVCYTKLLR